MFEQLMAQLGRALDARQVPYIVIGGQAVLHHGEPRFTRDIDISLGVDSSQVHDVLGVAADCGLRPVPPNPVQFVEQTFILPAAHDDSGLRVDFAFTFTPFEREAIARGVLIQLAGYGVRFASAEDLIIHKLFAGRPRDVEDICGILARQGAKLDREYVRRWIREFAKLEGKQHLVEQLEELFSRL